MQSPIGTFIVLEGSDGSGKGTQFELLKQRLIDAGYDIEVFDFPRYDKPSSHFVKKYLNGGYGPASSISPYTASLFFALDRYEAAQEIRQAIESGKVVLSNRYVGSNMAHQGSKFSDTIEKRSFFVWEDSLEYQLLGIPRPSINLFLKVPAEISYELISQKAKRDYTDKSHDEHEADINHLRNSVETYSLLCDLFPKDFKALDCVKDGKLLDIETISNLLWGEIEQFLPYNPQAAEADESMIDDVSEEVLDNPATHDELLIDLKKISLLAIFELIKLGAKIDADWSKHWAGEGSKYSFYTPEDLKGDLLKEFKADIENAATHHKKLLAKLGSDIKYIATMAVPLAATFSARLSVQPEKIAEFLSLVRLHPNKEVAGVHNLILESIKTPETPIGEPKDDGAAPQPISKIMEELSAQHISQNLSAEEESKLELVHPRNEFELIADGMYAYSEMSREELLNVIAGWDYEKKENLLKQSLNSEAVQEIAEYTFDLLTDHISIIKIAACLEAVSFKAQYSSVRYGYEVPEVLDQLHAEDDFLTIFDDFLGLYSRLQADYDNTTAKYAVMSGNKVRCQLKLNLKSLIEIKKKYPTNTLEATLLSRLTALIAENHPITAKYIDVLKPTVNKVKPAKKNR